MAILTGPTIIMRPPRADDAQDRLALGNSPEIMRMLGADPNTIPPLTLDGVKHWLDSIRKQPCAWIVEHEGRLLGDAKVLDINREDKRARLALAFYDDRKLGNGLGKEAVRLILEYCFVQLKMHRVGVRVLAYNERAIRCYRACGFVEEGRERECAHVDGKWHDDLTMGILASEFQF